ncbi:TOBE domain-containing protein [Tabrizicola sp.]|uniref:ABC transporter ATP-binding protein n=1 Tax=Tabrizicola sp. TaxID=2005166 RepID=UPI00286C5C7B|nr:TOBE domain-containing protein [Tabrizicola sp.]
MSIQERTGVTFIVVSHDQEEAMTLADRIAVMDKGAVKQVGPPGEVYEHPASRFVANFLGSMSQYEARVTKVNGQNAEIEVPAFGRAVQAVTIPDLVAGEPLTLAIRPEKLTIHHDRPDGPNVIEGEIKDLAYFGKDSLYRVILPSGELLSVHAVNAKRKGDKRPDWHDRVWISFDPASAILLRD